MESNEGPTSNVGPMKQKDEAVEVGWITHRVDEMVSEINKIEQKVNEVAQFYSSQKEKLPKNSKTSSVAKEKDKEKLVISIRKQQQDAAQREEASAKRMQELMRQFSTILRQVMREKWSWPFMQPVDVEGLGLHDYYEIIQKPMDLSTIKNKMEAKDDTYKNVREIYADVRLVFKNAMTYNDERNDYHVMARSMLAKFEEKWLQLLPRVIEEETRLKEEEADVRLGMLLAQEIANAKSARDTSNELNELDTHLDQLREMVVQKCRKMSMEEKRRLGSSLGQLSPQDLTKALEIIADKNPGFLATAAEIDIDMDALTESTLWRLKIFVKEALKVSSKNPATRVENEYSKRKRDICNALAKSAEKRSKR